MNAKPADTYVITTSIANGFGKTGDGFDELTTKEQNSSPVALELNRRII